MNKEPRNKARPGSQIAATAAVSVYAGTAAVFCAGARGQEDRHD